MVDYSAIRLRTNSETSDFLRRFTADGTISVVRHGLLTFVGGPLIALIFHISIACYRRDHAQGKCFEMHKKKENDKKNR